MPDRTIINPTVIAAPTAAPSAAMPTIAIDHYYSMPSAINKIKGYIIIENAAKSVAASEYLEPIDRAEFLLYGYVSPDDKPAPVLELSISSPYGRIQTPFEVDTCDLSKVYVRQGSRVAVGGPTAQNPAFKYQLVWE